MPASDTAIRSATVNDLVQIKHCAEQAYTKYIERMGQKPAPMIADFKQQITAGIVSVASTPAEIVGFVVFYVRDDHMHMENIAVMPHMAGQGVGKKLITHVEQQAKEKSKTRIELYTNEAMHENFGLYEHLGYSVFDRREEAGFRRVFFSKNI